MSRDTLGSISIFSVISSAARNREFNSQSLTIPAIAQFKMNGQIFERFSENYIPS
jgi:hypothetical protein